MPSLRARVLLDRSCAATKASQSASGSQAARETGRGALDEVTRRRSGRDMAPLPVLAGAHAARLPRAHLGGTDQLNHANRTRKPVDRVLAAVDAAMPDAFGLDAQPVTVPQLVNAI